MTVTSDPTHPMYLDQADVRTELSRVFDICHGCQRCVDLCASFPTLFEFVGRHADHDAGRMTPFEQDQVVDQCYQCTLCSLDCPYVTEPDDSSVDFPRLMLRAKAMQHAEGIASTRGSHDPDAQPHRPARKAGHVDHPDHRPDHRVVDQPDRQPDRPVAVGVVAAQADRTGHRCLRRPAAAAICQTAILDLVRAASADDVQRPDVAGTGHGVPDLRRRVPGAGHRQGSREGLRTQRHRVHGQRRGLLRRAVAARR